MKALAIVGLIFAALSIFIPAGGVIIAMICSITAIITFRSQPTLSGIIFGLDIINTIFLSPVLMAATKTPELGFEPANDTHMVYIWFHIGCLTLAIVWRLILGAPKQEA